MFACCKNTGLLVSSEQYIWERARELTSDLFCRCLTYIHAFLEFYEGLLCINLSGVRMPSYRLILTHLQQRLRQSNITPFHIMGTSYWLGEIKLLLKNTILCQYFVCIFVILSSSLCMLFRSNETSIFQILGVYAAYVDIHPKTLTWE